MPNSAHSEVISVLAELYTLLNALAAVPPGALWLPKPDTHSDAYESDAGEEASFDTKAARAVGFTANDVRLMAALPYWDHPIYIQPSTRTISQLGHNENGLAEERELFMGCDKLLPLSAVRLTESSSICGTDFIYDVEKKLVYRWPADSDPHSDDNNEESSEHNPDYFHYNLPSSSPRDALQPIIAKFRGLHYINKPPWDGSEHELLVSEPEPEFSEYPRDIQREALYRKLRDLNLEWGWNVEAVEQTAFRRAEFLEKRRDHLNHLFGARANLYSEVEQIEIDSGSDVGVGDDRERLDE